MIERYAPTGRIWLCMMCGKTAKDCFTNERGWDESCALNCILVDEATKQPTELEVQAFVQERERQLQRMNADFDAFLDDLESGESGALDPELLALAQQAIDAHDKRANAAGGAPQDGVQSVGTFNKETRHG